MLFTRALCLSSRATHNQLMPLSRTKLICPTSANVVSSRCLSTTTTNLKKEENINKNRIYYGSLASRMKAVKVFSLTTSLTGIAAQPLLMEQGVKIGGAGMAVFLCTVGGFFTFVTPLLLHFVTKKYVTEIHYDPASGEYTATTISLLLRKLETKFKPSDVTVPEVPGMFTSFLVGKTHLFVEPTLFDDPEHYVKIMGYDKPIDFKLNLTETASIEDKQDKKVDK